MEHTGAQVQATPPRSEKRAVTFVGGSPCQSETRTWEDGGRWSPQSLLVVTTNRARRNASTPRTERLGTHATPATASERSRASRCRSSSSTTGRQPRATHSCATASRPSSTSTVLCSTIEAGSLRTSALAPASSRCAAARRLGRPPTKREPVPTVGNDDAVAVVGGVGPMRGTSPGRRAGSALSVHRPVRPACPGSSPDRSSPFT